MIVPIAESLRQEPLLIGASIMVSAMSAGMFLAPAFVDALEGRARRGGDPLAAALGIAALVLVAFGAVSFALTGKAELVAWVIIGLAFGGIEAASRDVALGQLVADADATDHRRAIADLRLATATAVPLGFAIWAVLLNHIGPEAAVLFSAACLLLGTWWGHRTRPPTPVAA